MRGVKLPSIDHATRTQRNLSWLTSRRNSQRTPAACRPRGCVGMCDPKSLAFKTTAELKPFEGLIGQERALEALDLGARIDKPGFNVFVLGERGTARHGTVRVL